MCPNCRAFITTVTGLAPIAARVGRARSTSAARRNSRRSDPAGALHHGLILLINAGFFAATLLAEAATWAGTTTRCGRWARSSDPHLSGEHEWWRLVTAGFLHGGWLHILMNSWVLYDLGAQVEQVYGTPRFLVIYFAGTVAGFYLSAVMNPMVLSIGSSAGITGLIGAMIAFGVANRTSRRQCGSGFLSALGGLYPCDRIDWAGSASTTMHILGGWRRRSWWAGLRGRPRRDPPPRSAKRCGVCFGGALRNYHGFLLSVGLYSLPDAGSVKIEPIMRQHCSRTCILLRDFSPRGLGSDHPYR